MDGMRVARKYLEKQSDKALLAMWELSKQDTSHEGITINYLIEAELQKRKLIEGNKIVFKPF